MQLFLLTIMNGFTLAALYFLVASGFTLVFGLMRNVNLAHGSLYLLGAYIGYDVADLTGSWFVGGGRGIPLHGGRRGCCCRSASSAAWRGRSCARPWSPSASPSCWPT